MIVKDEEGNERELQIGDLIGIKDGDGLIKLIGRVNNLDTSCDHVYWIAVGKSYGDAHHVSRIVYLSSEPPDDDKGMSLADRHQNLKSNLARASDRCDYGSDGYDLLNRVVEKLKYPEQDHWFWWSVAESIADPRKISYAPAMRDVDNNARRRYCSVAKFLKGPARQKGLSITDAEADRVGQLVGDHFPDSYDYTFDVVRGLVQQAYRDADVGDMHSCMTGGSYVRWYDENPDKVGIVKIMQGSNYVGRALIWNTDQGVTVVDRVYPSNNGPHTNALHKWCEENGYDYKTSQTYNDGCLKSGRMDYTVTMAPSEDGDWPYLDTFKYTDNHPESSDSIKLELKERLYAFRCTSGGYDGGLSCRYCDDRISEDECHSDDNGYNYCRSCYEENFVYLSYTRPNGRHVEEEYHIDDTTECEHCGNRFDSGHTHEVGVGPGAWDRHYWCEQCIEDSAATCCECSNVVACDIVQVDVDGDPWCPPCFERKCAVCDSCEEAHLKADLFKCVGEVRCASCCEGYEGARPLLEVLAEEAKAKAEAEAGRLAQQAQTEQQAGPINGWGYPTAWPCYARGCTCSTSVEIARRRREYFLQQIPCPNGDEGTCPICRIGGLTLNEYIAAPYPNAREREIIEQQQADAAASNPLPAEGAINRPPVFPGWQAMMNVSWADVGQPDLIITTTSLRERMQLMGFTTE
jgi:hypothetical protein